MRPNTRNSDTHSMREHCPPLPSVSLIYVPLLNRVEMTVSWQHLEEGSYKEGIMLYMVRSDGDSLPRLNESLCNVASQGD
jgi:hypothetical protein